MDTRDQILNLKVVIEKNREYGKNIDLCFINYRKAFDMWPTNYSGKESLKWDSLAK